MTISTADIVARSDAGEPPAAISLATGIPAGRVYAVLRRERPHRARAPRRPTSLLPARVLALHGAGVTPKRIAAVCEVSAAYVYRILAEQRTAPPLPPPY